MQTQIALNIEKNHISYSVDGKEWICRSLTHVEIQVIKEAAKCDRMVILEDDKGQAALLSFFTLELCGKIKYGMDRDLKDFMMHR